MKISRIQQACFWIFSVSILSLRAQSVSVNGVVTDADGNPLSQASVRVSASAGVFQANEEGKFQLSLPRNDRDSCQISVSYLGKQPYTHNLLLNRDHIYLPKIVLQDLSLKLDEIAVQAQTGTGSTNSSLVINREMIERYPALSVNDLLNQLPNRSVTAPSLQKMQNVTLRGAFETMASSARNPYELINSFGIAVVMDDITLSNNANMQGFNPGIRGMSRSQLSIQESDYNLTGNRSANGGSYSGDNTFGGVDLRQIPAENIERIEVIAGVPSVRYGDLTDGAVIIERQAGRSPAYLRMQQRDNATSYSYSQGIGLGPLLGNFNLSLNYVNSFADNRDKIKQYNRINTTGIWTSNLDGDKRWKHTLTATYGRQIDGIKKDPDDPVSPRVSFNNWNMQASSRLSYQADNNFFKRIALNLGYSTGHQETYTESEYNDAFVLYTASEQTGIVEGIYDRGVYTAVNHYDGKPVNLTARLEGNAQWHTGKIDHQFTFGSTFDLSENKGKGRLADPSLPLKGLGQFSERYYDYKLAIPQKNWGFYAEDFFISHIMGKPLRVQAGIRMDTENGFNSFSPRTNLQYKLNKNWDIGFAYGLAFKAPGLAHRYPGPAFNEIVLLNAYNGKVNESTSRMYVNRYDPDPSNLHAAHSQTLELSTHWNNKGYRLSVNAFYKINRDGINTWSMEQVINLPQYTATPVEGQKPVVNESGDKDYLLTNNVFDNNLETTNTGFELMFSTPRFPLIATSFVISGGLYRSYYFMDAVYKLGGLNTNGSNPDDAITGYYHPQKQVSYSSNGRLGTVTHLPRLRMVVELTADFRLLNRTVVNKADAVPIGYRSRDLVYHLIDHFDPTIPIQQELFDARYQPQLVSQKQLGVYANFHLSLAKEIGKRLRLAFNVYNFLDYQPRYYNALSNDIVSPNEKPNFGAEISWKL